MKLSNGYILGSLGKLAANVKDKFTESAFFGFLHGDSALNDAVSDSAVVNMPGYIKEKLSSKGKKRKDKILAGRKPLKRAGERVGVADAADLPKSFGYILGGAVRDSKIIALLNGLWSSLCNTQASLIGALLLLTSISSFAVSLIKHIIKIATDADTFSLYLSLVTFMIAIFLVGAGTKSIYGLFTQSLIGSQFMKNVMGTRVIDENKKEEVKKSSNSSPKTFVVILFCLLFCVVSLWAGLERIVAFLVVACLLIAILKMPESGIMMLLIAFPWIGMLENGALMLSVISFLIMISWLWKLSLGKRVYSFRFIDSAVLVFMIFFLLAGIFNVSGTMEIQSSICYLTIGLLYFPISGLIRSSEWINRSMRAYTIGTLIVSFVGITQFIVRNIFSGSRIVFGITSAFNSNHSLCAYLLVGIFIGIFNIIEKNEQEHSISLKISLALNLICFVLAGSKTAYLAFAIAFLIYLLIKKPKAVAFVLFLIPFMIAVWVMMPDVLKGNVEYLLETTDVGLRSKMFIWSCVVDKTKDFLMFGIGTGASAIKTVLGDCVEYLPSSLQFFNLYITVAVQMGLFGLIILITLAVSAVQRGFFVFFSTQQGSYFRNLSACVVTATISLLVFGMGDSLWQNETLFLLFFFTVALSRCTKEVYMSENVAEDEYEELDIDISIRRSVKKEPELLVALLRFIVKKIRKTRKKKKISKAPKNSGSAQTDNSSEKIRIEEVDLFEEESAWQRK